jgi:hypothetical protein
MIARISIFSKDGVQIEYDDGVIQSLSIQKINQQIELYNINSPNNKLLLKEGLSEVVLSRKFQFTDKTAACIITRLLISEFGSQLIPISTSSDRALDLLSYVYKKEESLERINKLFERNVENFMLIFISQ